MMDGRMDVISSDIERLELEQVLSSSDPSSVSDGNRIGRMEEEENEEEETEFEVGCGKADITGPPYGTTMMGYGRLTQQSRGIHLRLFSRAFVIISRKKNNKRQNVLYESEEEPQQGYHRLHQQVVTSRRVLLIVLDLWSTPQALYLAILERIRHLYPSLHYGPDNVLITSTHTHSGLAGLSEYAVWSSGGFSSEIFDYILGAVTQSIEKAHENLTSSRIEISQGLLQGANINRSPEAYLRNSEEERARYDSSVDERMTLLKFVSSSSSSPLGALSFFPVHCTSMSPKNKLISSDNKGLAALYMEKYFRLLPESEGPEFVAGFGNTAEGDVTPCTQIFNKENSNRGESSDDIECTQITAKKQFEKALELFTSAAEPLHGESLGVHSFVDFENLQLSLDLLPPTFHHVSVDKFRTFTACLGQPSAAGAVDGPNHNRLFHQGQKKGTPVITQGLPLIFGKVSKEIEKGQAPKAILFAAHHGIFKKRPMLPTVLPLQLIQLGQLLLVGFPGEPTTMTGRRLEEMLLKELSPIGVRFVVVLSHCNTYSGYCTTPEEYQQQNYEGAMTLYGPFTQTAFQQEFNKLAVRLRLLSRSPNFMLASSSSDSYSSLLLPRRLRKKEMIRRPPKKANTCCSSLSRLLQFKGVVKDVKNKTVCRGTTVKATFWSANPNLVYKDLSMTPSSTSSFPSSSITSPSGSSRSRSSFLQVQKREEEEEEEEEEAWTTVLLDEDESTTIRWVPVLFHSIWMAVVKWQVPLETSRGTYRLVHTPKSNLRFTSRTFDVI